MGWLVGTNQTTSCICYLCSCSHDQLISAICQHNLSAHAISQYNIIKIWEWEVRTEALCGIWFKGLNILKIVEVSCSYYKSTDTSFLCLELWHAHFREIFYKLFHELFHAFAMDFPLSFRMSFHMSFSLCFSMLSQWGFLWGFPWGFPSFRHELPMLLPWAFPWALNFP